MDCFVLFCFGVIFLSVLLGFMGPSNCQCQSVELVTFVTLLIGFNIMGRFQL